MALKIYWTKRAEKSFNNILNYIHKEWGENIAKSFARRVFDFPEILSEFPEIGTLENKEKGIRGFSVIKQVSVFFRVMDDKIVLLNFFDNRQHPRKKGF